MKLSKRLQSIYNMVDKGAYLADVGADHGKLIIALRSDKVIRWGEAIENKKGPYSNLVKKVEEAKLANSIKCRLSDGISEISSSVDTIVLAGLGGETIINILYSHKEKLDNIETIIVDAHCDVIVVREKICQLGFFISDEDIIIEDKQFYEIIKFSKGTSNYNPTELEFGPINLVKMSLNFSYKCLKELETIEHLLRKNLTSARRDELLKQRERILRVWPKLEQSLIN